MARAVLNLSNKQLDDNCRRMFVSLGPMDPTVPLSSKWHTFAIVSPSENPRVLCLEQFWRGYAQVVTDTPANRHLVEDGEHDVLMEFGDSEAIAQAILSLVANPDKRRRL